MNKKFKLYEEFKNGILNEATDIKKDPESLTLDEKDFDTAYNGLTKFRTVLLDVLLNDNSDIKSIRPKMEELYKEVTLTWPTIKQFYETQKEYLEKKLLETPSEDIKPEETSTEIEPKTEE